MTEMKRLIVGDGDFEIVDEAVRNAVAVERGRIDNLASASLSRIKYKILPNDEFQGALFETDRKSFQSAEYNSRNGNFILLYSDGDNTGDCLFVELDENFEFIRRKLISADAVGHGNDLTYCPDTNKYIIVTQRTGGLAIVDADTLVLDSLVTLDEVGITSQVSYNQNDKTYYVADTSFNLYRVSSDFSTVERISTISVDAFLIPYDDVTTRYMQGSCVLDGRFISSWWLGSTSIPHGRLISFSTDGTTALNCYDFLSHSLSDELETVVNRDGQLFVFSYQGEKIYVDYFSTYGAMDDYLYPMPLKRYFYTSNSTILDDIHEQSSEQSFYQAYISFTDSHSVLGGTNGVLIGAKISEGYGIQVFVSPNARYMRNQWNGTWSDWSNNNTKDGSVSAGTSTTITNSNCYIKNGIFFLNVSVTFSAEIARYTSVIWTNIKCATGAIAQLCNLDGAQTSYNVYIDKDGTSLRASQVIPQGSYKIYATYPIY